MQLHFNMKQSQKIMFVREVDWLIPHIERVDDPLLIFTACDNGYLDYASSLVRSVDLFSPGFAFVLHLINPDSNSLERVQQLRNKLRFTRLSVSFERIDLSELDQGQQRVYFASARFPQLSRLLVQTKTPILSLDADSLIVNPIDLNFSDKLDAEVVIVRRHLKAGLAEQLAVATGSIWFKPTENVCKFVDAISKQVDEHLKEHRLKWFLDQIIFYRQMQQHSKVVRFYNLKRKYADWDFSEGSIVWAGKGPRKENDMRFFLLGALLSNDPGRRNLANRLWANFKSTGSDLMSSQWLASRFDTANKSITRIALFMPRLDLPWKRGKVSSLPPLIGEDVLDLRLHWKEFSVRLANAIERTGTPVDIIEIRASEMNRQFIESAGAALAFVPHRCHLDFEEGATPVLFYMQEFFRWVFVVNERGWSAASSQYPVDLSALPDSDYDSFSLYRQRLLAGELGSKFGQKEQKKLKQLIAEGSIPTIRNKFGLRKIRPYIFLPLQIPHDQSIQYFSDLAEQVIVENLVHWANERDIALVMKPHPANRKSMAPFEAMVDGRNIFWSDAHVHDLIAHATGVYTINSGVGFEALLHIRPVVTFGKVEYDCVTFKATTETLDDAWEYCIAADNAELESRYRRFINWFLNEYSIDMSPPERVDLRFEQIAAEVLVRVRKTTEHGAS